MLESMMDEIPSAGAPVEAAAALGTELFALVEELYPICRSITGDGVRKTLAILSRFAPLTLHEVPSGTQVLDWTVPKEWNIRDAYIKDASGRRVVDFQAHNLHVVNYSAPVHQTMSLAALRPHLHTLPAQPDLIPYRTSYYQETWGFCLSQQQLDALPEGEYEVCIDSALREGSLSYGELVLPGTSADEILISTHVCHPSLVDDNLTGLAISILLARELASQASRRYTLRFLYAPGTIGAITWLAQNRERAGRVRHGLTLTCLGDEHPFTYKKTVHGAAEVDRIAALALSESGLAHQLIDFFPYGYDERQYNSPGFRLPVGSLMRGRHGQFAEYHTSADNLSFVSSARMLESLGLLRKIVRMLEGNLSYRNLQPWGEPQLGKRGLYKAMGGTDIPGLQLALLWVLNLSDGRHSILDIAERAKLSFDTIRHAADLLLQHDLLGELGAGD
ncbi:MAG: peptidase [Myxococcaceae bacterium]|nr:peptidase [Myxococcaceae bacterium]